MYEFVPGSNAAALWYLAVTPEHRGKGIGSKVYQEIRQRIARDDPRTKALFYEVEDPDTTHAAEERQLAIRRIAFYQSNGAQLLRGIHYTQSVGWQPPIPMHLMVHPYQEIEVDEVFELAQSIFQDALQQVGRLELH
jgi:GNAT superfamily N-acetyltransferase